MKKTFILVACALVVIVSAIFIKISTDAQKPDEPKAKAGSYIALGDSVAAGVGLKDYSDSSACNRTNQSYPNVIATSRNYSLINLACSGATTQNGILGSQDVNKFAVTPQLDNVLSSPRPDLITMTIGANDANWTTYIQKCYTGNCGDDQDTAETSVGIANAASNVGTVLTKIQEKYSNDTPAVVVTGYYKLFPVTIVSDCSELTGIQPSELTWISQLQDKINTSLKDAVTGFDFATFVPLDFNGHALCSADPWIQGLTDKQPYHPTEKGQTIIAEQIEAALNTRGVK